MPSTSGARGACTPRQGRRSAGPGSRRWINLKNKTNNKKTYKDRKNSRMERNNTCYAFSSIASIYESVGKESSYPESVNRRVCGVLRAYIDVEKLSLFIKTFEENQNIEELSPSLQKNFDLLSSKPIITSSKDAPVYGLLENEGSFLIMRLDGLAGPKKPNVGEEYFFLGRVNMYDKKIPLLNVEFKLPVPAKKASSQTTNTATTPIASPTPIRHPSCQAIQEPVRT